MSATVPTTASHPLHELWHYRHLLVSLTVRELRIRYKQSLLGIGWAICVPLSMMLIFTFVFTRAVNVVGAMNIDIPYALFAYTGLVSWAFFAGGLNSAVNSLVNNRSLVTKVYFPREVLPMSAIGSALIDFFVASAVLVGLIAYFHLFTEWNFTPSTAILFLPLVLVVQIMFMTGLALLLSMANLFYRDVRQVFTVILQLWMFATNVVYPLTPDDSLIGRLVALNPMTPVIGAYRDCLVEGRLPDAGPFIYAAIVAASLLVFGWTCFQQASFKFAERI